MDLKAWELGAATEAVETAPMPLEASGTSARVVQRTAGEQLGLAEDSAAAAAE